MYTTRGGGGEGGGGGGQPHLSGLATASLPDQHHTLMSLHQLHKLCVVVPHGQTLPLLENSPELLRERTTCVLVDLHLGRLHLLPLPSPPFSSSHLLPPSHPTKITVERGVQVTFRFHRRIEERRKSGTIPRSRGGAMVMMSHRQGKYGGEWTVLLFVVVYEAEIR